MKTKLVALLILVYSSVIAQDLDQMYKDGFKSKLEQIKTNPLAWEMYDDAGWYNLDWKKYRLAAPYYKKAIELCIGQNTVDPSQKTKLLKNLGTCYVNIGENDSAISYYTIGFKIDTTSGYFPSYIAFAYRYKADFSNYVKWFEKAKSMPSNKIDYDEIHLYNKIIKLLENPTGQAYLEYGNEMLEGDPESALTAYLKATKVDPKLGKGYFNAGYVYMQNLGNYKKAIEYYTKAIPFLSSMEKKNSYENIGLCYEKQKDYQNAIENYSRAVQQEPNFAKSTHFKLARVYGVLGNKEKEKFHKLKSY